MILELDDEVADSIVCSTIKQSMKYLKKDIKTLKAKKNLENFQKEDLGHNIHVLAALEIAYDYYGGNLR
jgi:hypothetical protein